MEVRGLQDPPLAEGSVLLVDGGTSGSRFLSSVVVLAASRDGMDTD